MLLKMEHLVLLVEDGEGKFKALPGLTEKQKETLRGIDAAYYELEEEHLITNYEELN